MGVGFEAICEGREVAHMPCEIDIGTLRLLRCVLFMLKVEDAVVPDVGP